MPKFDVEISDWVDIDVDEFLDNCDSSDIEEIVDYLKKNNKYRNFLEDEHEPKNIFDIEWETVINKLSNARRRLSNEDEEIIKKIAEKL